MIKALLCIILLMCAFLVTTVKSQPRIDVDAVLDKPKDSIPTRIAVDPSVTKSQVEGTQAIAEKQRQVEDRKRDFYRRAQVGDVSVQSQSEGAYSCSYMCRKSGVIGYLHNAPQGVFAVAAGSLDSAQATAERVIGPQGRNVCKGGWYLHKLQCMKRE